MMVVSPNALDCFRGPNGVCSSQVAAITAGLTISTSALACTVATGHRLVVSSTREQFRHLVPVTVDKHQPDEKRLSFLLWSS
jgi:hypothetical protein